MHVIVGAGVAGIAAAESLRHHEYRGPITLVGDQDAAPYFRPALSREYLEENPSLQELPPLAGPELYRTLGARFMRGTSAIAVNPQSRTVRLSTDETLHYDRLLIATVAEPRLLQLEGDHLDGLFVLPNLSGAARFRDAFRKAASILVIGGGPLGLEIVSAALRAGKRQLMLVERQRVPLSTVVPAVIGAAVRHHLQSWGLQCWMDESVVRLVGREHVEGAVLTSGHCVECDLIVAAIGTRVPLPAISGADVGDDALEVDALMRTTWPNVYCAGEAARVRDARGQLSSVKTYHEAFEQGWTAGGAMADHQMRPYVYKRNFRATYADANVQTFGTFSPDDVIVLRGDLTSRAAFALRDGVLVGASTFGRDGDAAPLARIDYGTLSPTTEMLADPSFDLGTLASHHE